MNVLACFNNNLLCSGARKSQPPPKKKHDCEQAYVLYLTHCLP